MTTATTTRETQITIAYEVLMMDETGKSKKQIADEFNVSPRSVTRYFEKYEEEAMDLVTDEEPEENTQLAAAFAPKEEVEEEPTETAEEEFSFEDDHYNNHLEEIDEDNKANTEIEEGREETQEQETSAPEEEPETEESTSVEEDNTDTVEEQPKKETTSRAPRERDEEGLTPNQRSILNTYLKQKASGNMEKNEDRKGKVGRAKKNVKTIRYITMEILEKVAATGNLTKANKNDIINEIMEAADTDEKTAKQYFSGHKIIFGDYQG